MNPKSFSATALSVASVCPSRYAAEYLHRSRGFGTSTAATLGTSVHGGLELFVKACYIDKTHEPKKELLLDFFKMSYMTTFDTSDLMTEDYFDGVEMLKAWYDRTIPYFAQDNVTVISCEVKSNFPIKTSLGEKPFNYIWDRFDQIGEREFKVVDYKTNRWGITPDDLKKKVQPRSYAVAAAIQLKREGKPVDRLWVEFDMLRHSGPVGIVFSRDQNVDAYKFILKEAQRVIDTDEEDAEERLNNECLFCVKKQTCKALLKNIATGGVHSIASVEDAVDLRAQLELQSKAVKSAIDELDAKIMAEAKERDELKFESEIFELDITASGRRSVDAERVEMAIGPALFSKYGSTSITMATVDLLLKGDELTDAQKKTLRSLIYTKRGEPRVRITPKSPIEGD